MRAVDLNLAVAVKNHWRGQTNPRVGLCPLLADLDRLLSYLDENGITPGHAISVCPECGQDHRWVLIKELMLHALDITPRRQSRLLEMVDSSLDEVRAIYGGEEGYRKYQKEAAEFFASVGANNCYKL